MNEKIGALVRQMRMSAGMSQMVLAEKLGVSYQQVQKYEKGKSKVSIEKMVVIAGIFGVPIMAFFEDDSGATAQAAVSNLKADEVEVVMAYRKIRDRGVKMSMSVLMSDLARMTKET